MQSTIVHLCPDLNDFPKGLRVLVIDSDEEALLDAKRKLEACEYGVTTFSSCHGALSAINDKQRTTNFHLAVVERGTSGDDSIDGLKFVSIISKRLPVILMSQTKSISAMMEGIAAGACEVLHKPLNVEHLKTIWQHVFRKTASKYCTLSLLREKSEASTDIMPMGERATFDVIKVFNPEYSSGVHDSGIIGGDVHQRAFLSPKQEIKEDDVDQQMPNLDCNMFLLSSSAPSLDSGSRDELTGSCCLSEAVISSEEKVEMQDYIESIQHPGKPWETSSDEHKIEQNPILKDKLEIESDFDGIALPSDLDGDIIEDLEFNSAMLASELSSDAGSLALSFDYLDDLMGDHSSEHEVLQGADEEALLLAEVAKVEGSIVNPCSYDISMNSCCMDLSSSSSSVAKCRISDRVKLDVSSSDSDHSGIRGNLQSKRKLKVDWTPDLHRRFVQAVHQLGVNKAIPSKILEVMGVEGLTRQNIASHLQKYRSHKKHLKASKETVHCANSAQSQQQQIEVVMQGPTSGLAQVVAPPVGHLVQAACALRGFNPAPVSLGYSIPVVAGAAGIHVWGHPSSNTYEQFWSVKTTPLAACVGHPTHFHPHPVSRLPLWPLRESGNIQRAAVHPTSCSDAHKVSFSHLTKEAVDAAIREVMKNPFTPLPLGLKPPVWESIQSELQKQVSDVSLLPYHNASSVD